MSDVGLGIPQIKPRHRAAWQDSHAAPGRPDCKNGESDNNGPVASDSPPAEPPPEPGTGKIVDRVV